MGLVIIVAIAVLVLILLVIELNNRSLFNKFLRHTIEDIDKLVESSKHSVELCDEIINRNKNREV